MNVVSADQANTNDGDTFQGNAIGIAAIVYAGVAIGVIGQSNYVEVDAFYNGAFANTGGNAQFSGPQVNITGQLALAGAQGGGALSLGLIGAGALGGDADSTAANAADSSSWQQVANNLTTGIANRSTHWRSPQRRRTPTPATGLAWWWLLTRFSTRVRSTSPTEHSCNRSGTLPSRTAATSPGRRRTGECHGAGRS